MFIPACILKFKSSLSALAADGIVFATAAAEIFESLLRELSCEKLTHYNGKFCLTKV